MLIPLLSLSLVPPFIPTGSAPFTHGVVGAPSPAAVASVIVDSSMVAGHAPLTADLLTHYLALKQDLQAFWRSHQMSLETAQAHAQRQVVMAAVGGMMGRDTIHVLDYVALTAQDPALSALFTKHHVSPSQFAPTEEAVYTALLALIASIHTGTPLNATNVVEKNAMLVQPHRQALAAVGVHEEGPPGED